MILLDFENVIYPQILQFMNSLKDNCLCELSVCEFVHSELLLINKYWEVPFCVAY